MSSAPSGRKSNFSQLERKCRYWRRTDDHPPSCAPLSPALIFLTKVWKLEDFFRHPALCNLSSNIPQNKKKKCHSTSMNSYPPQKYFPVKQQAAVYDLQATSKIICHWLRRTRAWQSWTRLNSQQRWAVPHRASQRYKWFCHHFDDIIWYSKMISVRNVSRWRLFFYVHPRLMNPRF